MQGRAAHNIQGSIGTTILFNYPLQRAGLVLPSLSLLPLHVLLQQLAPDSVPSSGVAEVQLERERFRYTLGLLCPWHRAYTDTDSCSAATVRRQAYTVLDLVRSPVELCDLKIIV